MGCGRAVAELLRGGARGLRGRHAIANEFFLQHFAVQANLVGKFAVQAGSTRPQSKAVPESHTPSITRAMAAKTKSNSRTSSASCFLPAVVILDTSRLRVVAGASPSRLHHSFAH